MKMEDVDKIVKLHFERREIRSALDLVEANHNYNLRIGIGANSIGTPNTTRSVTSSRVIDRFREALKQALDEVDKEIELI